MNILDFLSQGKKLNDELLQLLEEREAAFHLACKVTSSLSGDRVLESRKNTSEIRFINYADYALAIEKKINELYSTKTEILNIINKTSDITFRAILVARYINFKTIAQIAEDLGYAERHVLRLHKRALEAVSKHVIECHVRSVL